MINVRNPNYVPPVTQQDKDDLLAALAALPADRPGFTWDEVRAALPGARKARFTDGQICEVARALGLELA